jgi:serine/threonine-protein kinase
VPGLDRDLLIAALPGYDVGAELGRGGWGIVCAGSHRQLGRQVAIKELPRAFGADPDQRRRFLAEAQLVAGMDHPHLVRIYDYVEHEGLCAIVMELLTGGTLWDRFTDRGLRCDEALAVVLATCSALVAAHEQGVLHRDIKPENVMFSDKGVVKLTDFGIAKVLDATDTVTTAAGVVVGTPAYMAPEQATGGPLSPATDVYALAVVLYELLAGRLPYPEVDTPLAQLLQTVQAEPEPLAHAAPQLPEALGAVVQRGLAKDPAERWPTADAFARALAVAATDALGAGWLRATGITVAGLDDVVALTERAGGTRPTIAPGSLQAVAAATTGHVRFASEAVQTDGQRVPSVESFQYAPPPRPPVPLPPRPPTFAEAAAGQSGQVGQTVPGAGPAGGLPAGSSTTGGGSGGRGRTALLVAAIVVVAALLAGIAAVVALGGGGGEDETAATDRSTTTTAQAGGGSGDGDDGSDEPTTTTTPSSGAELAVTAEQEAAFRGLCDANDVTDVRCSCVLDKVATQLTATQWEEALDLALAEDGTLTDELLALFEACVAEGQ